MQEPKIKPRICCKKISAAQLTRKMKRNEESVTVNLFKRSKKNKLRVKISRLAQISKLTLSITQILEKTLFN